MDSKPIVVQCRSGNRSAIGASILKAKGAKEVINMMATVIGLRQAYQLKDDQWSMVNAQWSMINGQLGIAIKS